MNVKEWAERLNGREYLKELTSDEEKQAADDGVVIVFGQSNYLVEFRGVFNTEQDVWEGGAWKLTPDKKVFSIGKNKEICRLKQVAGLPEVRAIWSPTSGGTPPWASWEIQSAIPHETFDIMDDGDIYCRGIVFAWADAFPKKDAYDEMIADGREILAKQEAAEMAIIGERDAAEDMVDKLLDILEVEHEWSNAFGYAEAIQEAEASIDQMKSIAAFNARAYTLKEAADRAVSFVDDLFRSEPFKVWNEKTDDNLRAAIMGGKV